MRKHKQFPSPASLLTVEKLLGFLVGFLLKPTSTAIIRLNPRFVQRSPKKGPIGRVSKLRRAFKRDKAAKRQDYKAEEGDEQHSEAEMRKFEGGRVKLWPRPRINNTANEWPLHTYTQQRRGGLETDVNTTGR